MKAFTWRRDLRNLIKSQEDLEAGRPSRYLDRVAILRRHKGGERQAWLLDELGESREGSTETSGGPMADRCRMFTRNEERKR